MSTKLVMIDLY